MTLVVSIVEIHVLNFISEKS